MLLCYKNLGREKVDHDILSEDDFFEQLKKEKRQPSAPQEESEAEEKQPTPEEPLETDLFEMEQEEEPPVVDETPPEKSPFEQEEELLPEVGEEPPIEPHPFEEESFASYDDDLLGNADFSGKEEAEKVEEEPPPPPAEPQPKIFVPEDKVEDEKLPGLSKKPVIIWSVVALVVIVGVFILFSMFSGEKKVEPEQKAEETQQTPAETPASAPTEDPILAKQKEYLGQLAAVNSQNFAVIGNLFSSVQKNNVQISSLLFYGNELSIEIFGKNRDQLAKALMDIRTSLKSAGLRVVASDERPGDGITSVLSVKLPQNAGSGEINAKLASVNEASQWLKMLAQQFSVSISPVKEIGTKAAQFNLNQHRLQFKIKGSYENCVRFFSALGQSNRNLKLHKMVFSSLDQQSFSKSKYQADFIADLYF